MLCVIAAGNNRSTPNPTPFVNSPGDMPTAITVAAGEARPPDKTRLGSFSAVGPDPGTADYSGGESSGVAPNIAAPGVKVTALVASETGTTSETTLSGTSMAAPCVTGGLGLLLAGTDVEQKHDPVLTRLTDYARPAPKAGVEEAGAGWLSVESMIDEINPEQPQADARTDSAQARDESWRSLSSSYGASVANLFL
jgi:subtilisin family serine protease